MRAVPRRRLICVPSPLYRKRARRAHHRGRGRETPDPSHSGGKPCSCGACLDSGEVLVAQAAVACEGVEDAHVMGAELTTLRKQEVRAEVYEGVKER